MKYIFLLLLICSSHLSFGQMSVSEMMKVYDMDLDQFETYAIMKGYEFHKIANEDDIFGHQYSKGKGDNTKYISLYTNWFSVGKKVGYQTSNSNEYLNFKNEIKNKGFVLLKTDEMDGAVYKLYNLNKWELRMYTTNDSDGVTYEISLIQK